MKKGSRLLIGLTAAALTFGSLMAFMGPDKFGAHCSGWKHHGCHSTCESGDNGNLQTESGD